MNTTTISVNRRMAACEIEIDPALGRAGIDTKAGVVSKVVAAGQSDRAGVKAGWKVPRSRLRPVMPTSSQQVKCVAGKDMPPDSKIILAALKQAKEAGIRYKVVFQKPASSSPSVGAPEQPLRSTHRWAGRNQAPQQLL